MANYERERERERGGGGEKEREGERNVFIGNSTSWITYIQGAEYVYAMARMLHFYKFTVSRRCYARA